MRQIFVARRRGRLAVAAAIASVIVLSLAACSSSGGSGAGSGGAQVDGPTVSIQLAAFQTTGDPYLTWLNNLASKIGSDTGGKVKIKVFPNAQLVSQAQAPSAIHSNSVGMGQVQDNALDQFSPGLDVLELPFLFDSQAQADAATESADYRNTVNQTLNKSGLMMLASCSAGIQALISSKPITGVAQMSGLKLRVSSAADVKLYNGALKANEQTVTLAETYEALKLGTVHAAVSTPLNIAQYNWQQVAKYLDLIPVRDGIEDLIINMSTFNQLSKAEQDIVVKDSAAAIPACNKANGDANAAAVTKMQGAGVHVVKEDDGTVQAFKQATQSVRDDYVKGGHQVSHVLLKAATSAAASVK